MIPIEKFVAGATPEGLQKLNDLVERVNSLHGLLGDGIIEITQGPRGRVIRLNIKALLPHLPGLPVGARGDVLYFDDSEGSGEWKPLAAPSVDSVFAFDALTELPLWIATGTGCPTTTTAPP